jgi:hypothetical protein
MKRVWISCFWVLWIASVTIITVGLHVYLDPIPDPQSSVVEFAAKYVRALTRIDASVMTLAWGLERVVPIHLGIYLAWRVFKAICLR